MHQHTIQQTNKHSLYSLGHSNDSLAFSCIETVPIEQPQHCYPPAQKLGNMGKQLKRSLRFDIVDGSEDMREHGAGSSCACSHR